MTSTDDFKNGKAEIDTTNEKKYVLEINEHNRATMAKKRPHFVKRKGFSGYHKRKPKAHSTKFNVKRQLNSWKYKLDSLDTTKPMLFVTLTTCSSEFTFKDLRKRLKFFLGKVSDEFKSYYGYLRRFGLTEDFYKHIHLILFFDAKHTPRNLTRKWMQQFWNLGISIDVKKVYSYAGVKNYICEEEEYTYFKEDGVWYSKYDNGLKLISSSLNLEKTKDTIRMEGTKEEVEKIIKELNLNHWHEDYHFSLINGKWVKIVDRVYYYKI